MIETGAGQSISTSATQRRRGARLADYSEAEIERRNLEIWSGEEVEKMSPAGKWHADIADELYFLLRNHLKGQRQIKVGGENRGFLISKNPDVFLSPDCSVFTVRQEAPGPWHQFAPEIAMEIKSPGDTRAELLKKAEIYLRCGVAEVWLFFPEDRSLVVHALDGSTSEFTGAASISAGLLNGLQLDLDELLSPKSPE